MHPETLDARRSPLDDCPKVVRGTLNDHDAADFRSPVHRGAHRGATALCRAGAGVARIHVSSPVPRGSARREPVEMPSLAEWEDSADEGNAHRNASSRSAVAKNGGFPGSVLSDSPRSVEPSLAALQSSDVAALRSNARRALRCPSCIAAARVRAHAQVRRLFNHCVPSLAVSSRPHAHDAWKEPRAPLGFQQATRSRTSCSSADGRSWRR